MKTNYAISWKSSSANIPFRNLDFDEVIQLVTRTTSGDGKHTTSYKFAFFKSILDNIFNINISDNTLRFNSIAIRFTEIYWNLILKYNLRQMRITVEGKCSGIERLIKEFWSNNEISEFFPFENLTPALQLEITNLVETAIVKKYVLGAFCGDTDGQFYHFDKKDDFITLNPSVVAILEKYKISFEKLNYYSWIKFLESVNEEHDAFSLARKLDSSTERSDLTIFRKTLVEFGQNKCFYCGKELSRLENAKAVPVDHFIPWSFIKDDNLWNFVLACQECNSKKSNILSDDFFVQFVIDRNKKLVNVKDKFVQEEFKAYRHEKLIEIYKSAKFNGFKSGWKPKVSYTISRNYDILKVADSACF